MNFCWTFWEKNLNKERKKVKSYTINRWIIVENVKKVIEKIVFTEIGAVNSRNWKVIQSLLEKFSLRLLIFPWRSSLKIIKKKNLSHEMKISLVFMRKYSFLLITPIGRTLAQNKNFKCRSSRFHKQKKIFFTKRKTHKRCKGDDNNRAWI